MYVKAVGSKKSGVSINKNRYSAHAAPQQSPRARRFVLHGSLPWPRSIISDSGGASAPGPCVFFFSNQQY